VVEKTVIRICERRQGKPFISALKCEKFRYCFSRLNVVRRESGCGLCFLVGVTAEAFDPDSSDGKLFSVIVSKKVYFMIRAIGIRTRTWRKSKVPITVLEGNRYYKGVFATRRFAECYSVKFYGWRIVKFRWIEASAE
jgi:hypothetical protein